MFTKGIKYLVIFVICVLSSMYLFASDFNMMNYDEAAVYLYPGFLVSKGLAPYVDFSYSQPPGLLMFGGLTNLRFISAGLVLLSAGVVALLGRKFGVGWFACVFFLSSPMIMEFGKVFMGDIPLIAITLAFLYVVIVHRDRMYAILVAGVLIWLGFMVKIQAIVIMLPVVFYLMLVKNRFRYVFAFIVFMGLFTYTVVSYDGLIEDVFIKNAVVFGFGDRVFYLGSTIAAFIYKSIIMLPFALVGAKELYDRRGEYKFNVLGVFIMTALITVVLHTHINFRHLMFIIPALAILAGIGLKKMNSGVLTIGVLVVCILVPFGDFHESTLYDSDTRDIVSFVKGVTTEGDYIYTDEPMIGFLSERMMPDSAIMWNGLGRERGVAVSDVIIDIYTHKPKLVLLVTGVGYKKMNGPRMISTFGEDDSERLIEHLDRTYDNHVSFKRNYQDMTLWVDNIDDELYNKIG